MENIRLNLINFRVEATGDAMELGNPDCQVP